MSSRWTIGLPAAFLGLALLAPSSYAQGRGMHAPSGPAQARSSARIGVRGELGRPAQRRFFNDAVYLYPPYFFPDDEESDYGPVSPEAYPAPHGAPIQMVEAPAAPPAAANPVEPLLLENRGGQWVRIPTGNQMEISQSGKPSAASVSNLQPGISVPIETAPPLPELPPAIIVFRDGHMEEVGKYMIQGDTLFTTADYWTTGSWTRKIPLAELNLPASLKLNNERGSKFNLPSGPNEVVIRF
jgi:hypothetical protein